MPPSVGRIRANCGPKGHASLPDIHSCFGVLAGTERESFYLFWSSMHLIERIFFFFLQWLLLKRVPIVC